MHFQGAKALTSSVYLISRPNSSPFEEDYHISSTKNFKLGWNIGIFPSLSGLTATKNFLLQYGQVLQELDLSILAPLWNQKYGSKFDYVAAHGAKQEIWDYFLKPPLEKTRCFIWLLEENREHFPGLHEALDEFFDKMGE